MSQIIRAPGRLRATIEDAKREGGLTLSDLTVLAAQNDPYRCDTPAGHRDAAWFKEQHEIALKAGGRERDRIHLRGIHYSVIATGGVLKPNSKQYRNDDPDWSWLQIAPAKAARWLGYVDFSAIADERNAAPVFHYQQETRPEPYLSVNASITLPSLEDLEPYIACIGFQGRQPYHLSIFGEKSSLEDVLLPIAREYEANLFLPTGEISDTQIHAMARHAIEDGRPLKVFTISDCDPAGWQMPISIGRKLQAIRTLLFPELDFEVVRVGLTPEQAKELDLPSAPLKETERRASKWVEAFGIEQTEIDALSTLRPDVLEQIVREALDPYYDHGLRERVRSAYDRWLRRAEEMLEEQSSSDFRNEVLEEAAAKLSELEAEVASINEALRQSLPDEFDYPPILIPEPNVDPSLHGKPLISSAWTWVEQTRALKQQKAYAVKDEAA